jgi:HEAT repeat protein
VTLLVGLALPAAPNPTPPSPVPANLSADEQSLKNAHVEVTAQGVVGFLRNRIPGPENDAAVAPLVKQLTDKDAAGHAKAAADLVALGPAAVKPLRVVANNIEDTDAAARAQKCLALIEGPGGANLVISAVHLVGGLKPDGGAAVLLEYLPYADDAAVAREIEAALALVAVRDGKPDAAVLKALEDETPARRSAAAVALCQAGGISAHERVRPLLKDPKPTVRFQAALALANAHDAEVVPILIDLLAELPSAQRKDVENWLTDLAGEWGVKVPQGNDATARRLRRELWLAWWKNLDGKQLAEEFRSRTLSDAEFDKVTALIKKLDGDSADDREKASQELVALGHRAVPLLRQAGQSDNARVAAMSAKCVELIEKDSPNPLPGPAARLLVLRRPEGTLETLLGYLPFADNDTLAEELRDLIVAVAFRDGKADPLLVKALEDKVPARRGAAAYALCRAEQTDHLAAVRKLLQDPDPEVRLITARGLASIRQSDAVPTLIALLGDLPVSRAWEIEDYLSHLADGKGPNVVVTSDPASRAKARDAWEAWWKEQGHTVNLAKVDFTRRLLGLTLVVDNSGQVAELDAAGKVRWKITGLNGPMDAQLVPGQRVLVAEQNSNRVTERDMSGKILWSKDGVAQPFVVQRLRNGNTFIAGRNQILEVDKDGKEVYSHLRQNEWLMAATKFRDGQIAYVNNQGQYIRLTPDGKEVKSYHVAFPPNFGFNVAEILPNDNVVISVQAAGKVTELTPEGKTAWEVSVQHSGVPCRLPNGHTLVPNVTTSRIAEFDRAGKLVAEMKDLPVRPWRVDRR